MIYSFKTLHAIIKSEDVMEIAAMFLYEQQNGNSPKWIHFPGDYETKDFFSVNEAAGKFLVSNKDRKVILLDSRKQAEDFAYFLGTLNEKKYEVYQGGINSDGFIAGPEFIEDWDNELFPERD